MKLIIYSPSKFGFWSNRQGWVQHATDATQFTKTDAKSFTLPMTKGFDAVWIKYNKQLFIDDFDDQVVLELTDKEARKMAKDQYQCEARSRLMITPKPAAEMNAVATFRPGFGFTGRMLR